MRLNASASYSELEFDPVDTFLNGRLRGSNSAAAGIDLGGVFLAAVVTATVRAMLQQGN